MIYYLSSENNLLSSRYGLLSMAVIFIPSMFFIQSMLFYTIKVIFIPSMLYVPPLEAQRLFLSGQITFVCN